MTVTAQLSATSASAVTVPFTVTGTATNGTDYTITASPITIAAGSTTGTATITITSDTLDEPNETVVLTMGTPTNANLGTTTVHTATITDDDPTPTVQWSTASQASANETGTMTVTAQLSAVSGQTVTVPFSVSGTATNGTDYTITASPITIAAGSTTGTATITITSDTLVEGNESVILTMGSPTNATLGTTTVHTATITDDDTAPVNSTAAGTATAVAASSSSITVTAPYTNDSNGNNTLKVEWGTGGTYTLGNQTLPHAASPYVYDITGLTANTTYNIRVTYLDILPDTVTGTAVQTFTVATPVYTSPLMHNSDNPAIGTTKHGTWGTGFTCATCHLSSSNNVKIIAQQVQTPTGPRTVMFNRMTTARSNNAITGVFGNDNRTYALNASTNICEVCHHNTSYHQYSSSKVTAGNKNHMSANNTDCTTCHSHAKGFAGSGCDGCHGNPPTTLASTLATPATLALGNPPTTGGVHLSHTVKGMTCTACHNHEGAAGHNAASIQIGFVVKTANWPSFAGDASTSFSTYSGNLNGAAAPVSNQANTLIRTSASTRNSCNVYCHGGWTGANGSLNPSWIITDGTQKACGTCHGTTAAKSPTSNAHPTHAGNAAGQYSFACSTCHGTLPTNNDHVNGTVAVTLTNGTYSRVTGIANPAAATGSCANTYCHSQGTSKTSNVGETRTTTISTPLTTLTWNSTDNCASCHGNPPNYTNGATTWGAAKANSHQGATHAAQTCDVCHSSVTYSGGVYTPNTQHANGTYSIQASLGYTYAATGGTCATAACHGSVAWGGNLGCVDCHAALINSPVAQGLDATVTQRRNAVGEHKNTWSHKRSSAGGVPANTVVTNEDCVVCHMEGNATTHKAEAGVHGNGYINLRDPDTGLNIKNVTWNGATPGAYVSGTTDVQFVRFSRDLGKTLETDPNWLTVAAIQINHCLKCHDANGATSTNAQVTTTGTAMRPFGVAITGHVAPLNTNGSGNVVNVAGSFATSNASYHPVIGKQNNSYVQGAQMVAPYNTVTKTNGNNTSYGALMSCWDCHATTAQTGIMTSTVTAHGGAVTIRGSIRVGGTTASTNLCVNCHATKYATTGTQHGAGSAFTLGKSNMSATTFSNCSYCHAYSPSGGASQHTSTSRPLRAEDVHGFNDRTAGTVGSKWTNGNRPYGFIRNSLTGWAPKSAVGDTIANPSTCSGSATASTCDDNMANDPNGLGGVY